MFNLYIHFYNSNFYFNKDAKDLTLNESALLAGLIKSPNKYSPISHKENALKRRNLVLKEMEKDEKITPNDYLQNSTKEIELDIAKQSGNKLNT